MTENDLRVHTVGWHFSTPKSRWRRTARPGVVAYSQ
uniref:Uncharacterized protein n=1 Tax=Anopheles arabiensis TaxID=7173 RepID=A0A182IG41_ANOAR